ncbi:dTDP-4-dehydrorhamnose reductase [Sulfitobacter sp. TSTF-M16]|uniref:dTDP-4-dehydrorhamnose reductase n=1 Tax=Sulfitobacter aestuariivivens TaxID=2766981 RepID=A0A927D8G3_9RHOB|nr:dTDP-4-dehydrorhamnose reductase [Sulfitobacter aestuariivivens]MBD3665142.1 dTDP-4-dehydrorhamnose reductase [Sulfitobacter aestuariivivens]
MNILVFGKNGQVAQELNALDGTMCLDRDSADLTNPDTCAALIEDHNPDAVINAAAYTAVDKAEEEEPLATVINGDAPGAMAKVCAALGIPFVHISTDYVFEGGGDAPWKPSDPTGPLGAYGRSKLAGERAVKAADGTYAILRTSWVFSPHGNNFVKTMLRLGAERDSLTIVADQIGGPTAARDIAAACHRIACALKDAPEKSGIYHFSGAPDCSWADFAREIFSQAALECQVTDIASAAYPTPATRPLNSRMDCSSTTTAFGIDRPEWRVSLNHILTDLGALS